MRPDFRELRAAQLDKGLKPFIAAKEIARPQKGCIRAIRQAAGITVRELALRLHRSPTVAAHFEKSEAEYRITLGSLRNVADALGCELVYALVPKNGSIEELVEQRERTKAIENVRAVEHSMSLEDQAVGGVERKIDEETSRLLERNRKR